MPTPIPETLEEWLQVLECDMMIVSLWVTQDDRLCWNIRWNVE